MDEEETADATSCYDDPAWRGVPYPVSGSNYYKAATVLSRHISTARMKTYDCLVTNSTNQCTKFQDVSYVHPPTAAWRGYSCINAVPRGTADAQRVGNQIRIRTIAIRGYVGCHSATFADFARCLLVYDKQCNGSAPAVTTMLSLAYSLDGAGGLANLNPANKTRFVILVDQYAGVTSALPMPLKVFWRGNLDVTYKDAADAIASVSTGALYLLVFQGNTLQLDMFGVTSRIRYVDGN